MRRSAAGLVVACVAAVTGAASGAGATPPRCASRNLLLEHGREFTAGSFHDYTNFALRNMGPTTCVLSGYPEVRFLDQRGRSMPVTVRRTHTYLVKEPVRTVRIGTWKAAYFTVFYLRGDPCARRLFPYGLRIVAPGSRTAMTVYDRLDLCVPPRAMVGPMRSRPLSP